MGYIKDINRILRVFDVFVLSSLSEGLPLSIVEASHSSLPIVATNVGGLSEVVIDGLTGFLVESGNSNALADKLILLLEDEALRKMMGPKGKQIVSEKFSIETMIESYQNLYEKHYFKAK
ncbi:MAG: glycosyltransferase [Candidatus Thorarchaeota archaeon]